MLYVCSRQVSSGKANVKLSWKPNPGEFFAYEYANADYNE